MTTYRGHAYVLSLAGLPEEALRYLENCARIREISCTRLIERLVRQICTDQLVLSVLDDDSKPNRRMQGEYGYSRYRSSASRTNVLEHMDNKKLREEIEDMRPDWPGRI